MQSNLLSKTQFSAYGLIIVAVLLSTGCATTPLVGMSLGPFPDSIYTPPDGKALLIVARPRNDYQTNAVVFVDENAEFAGSLQGLMHAVVPIEPGRHTYYPVHRGGGEPWIVTAEAGKVYVVALFATERTGKFTADVNGMRNGTELGLGHSQWIVQNTDPVLPSGDNGSSWVRTNYSVVVERMRASRNRWERQDAEGQAECTLNVGDGFSPEQFSAHQAGGFQLGG